MPSLSSNSDFCRLGKKCPIIPWCWWGEEKFGKIFLLESGRLYLGCFPFIAHTAIPIIFFLQISTKKKKRRVRTGPTIQQSPLKKLHVARFTHRTIIARTDQHAGCYALQASSTPSRSHWNTPKHFARLREKDKKRNVHNLDFEATEGIPQLPAKE